MCLQAVADVISLLGLHGVNRALTAFLLAGGSGVFM